VQNLNDWIKEIKINDLDVKNKELAEIIGIENLIKLSEYYGGTRIYVNKLEEVLKPIRDKKIMDEYNRYNVKDLAKKYNLAEESVRRIVRELGIEGQISLFDKT